MTKKGIKSSAANFVITFLYRPHTLTHVQTRFYWHKEASGTPVPNSTDIPLSRIHLHLHYFPVCSATLLAIFLPFFPPFSTRLRTRLLLFLVSFAALQNVLTCYDFDFNFRSCRRDKKDTLAADVGASNIYQSQDSELKSELSWDLEHIGVRSRWERNRNIANLAMS